MIMMPQSYLLAASVILMVCRNAPVDAVVPSYDPAGNSHQLLLPLGLQQGIVEDDISTLPSPHQVAAVLNIPDDRCLNEVDALSIVVSGHNQTSRNLCEIVGAGASTSESHVIPLITSINTEDSPSNEAREDDPANEESESTMASNNNQLMEGEDCGDASSTRVSVFSDNSATNADPSTSIQREGTKMIICPRPGEQPPSCDANDDNKANNDDTASAPITIGAARTFETSPETTENLDSSSIEVSRFVKEVHSVLNQHTLNLKTEISKLSSNNSALKTLMEVKVLPLLSNMSNENRNLASGIQNVNSRLSSIEAVQAQQQNELQSIRQDIANLGGDNVLLNTNFDERMTALEQSFQATHTSVAEVHQILGTDILNGHQDIKEHVTNEAQSLDSRLTAVDGNTQAAIATAATTIQHGISGVEQNLGQQLDARYHDISDQMNDQHTALHNIGENQSQQLTDTEEQLGLVQSRVKKPKKKSWRKKARQHAKSVYNVFSCAFKCLACCPVL